MVRDAELVEVELLRAHAELAHRRALVVRLRGLAVGGLNKKCVKNAMESVR